MPSDAKQISVTRDDFWEYRGGGVINFMFPQSSRYGLPIPLPPKLPAYWSPPRDDILRATVYHEPMWASAIGIAISRMTSASFSLTGNVSLRIRQTQELLQNAGDNEGWVPFLNKHLRDYLTTDNGTFIEIVRAKQGTMGSRIIGLFHLDSRRITRSGDPDFPAIYRDIRGRYHAMKPEQIIMLSDMPDPSETFYNVGTCSADRAYQAIYKLSAIETYVAEKVSGSRALAIHLVRGIASKQLGEALATADQEQAAKGTFLYKGAIIVPFLGGDVDPQLLTIPLAELPDGFDAKTERDAAYLIYANAIGLDPQDLQPLTGQPMGTGTQTVILAEKARGKGLTEWRQQFMHALNEWVVPDTVSFAFVEKDYRDKTDAAGVDQAFTNVAAAQVGAQIISAKVAAQILVDKGVLPRYAIEKDETLSETLGSEDKADVVEASGQSEKPFAAPEKPPEPGGEAPKVSEGPAKIIAPAAPPTPLSPQKLGAVQRKEAEDAPVLSPEIQKAVEDAQRELAELFGFQPELSTSEVGEIVKIANSYETLE